MIVNRNYSFSEIKDLPLSMLAQIEMLAWRRKAAIAGGLYSRFLIQCLVARYWLFGVDGVDYLSFGG